VLKRYRFLASSCPGLCLKSNPKDGLSRVPVILMGRSKLGCGLGTWGYRAGVDLNARLSEKCATRC
jgi:hypothetical protein